MNLSRAGICAVVSSVGVLLTAADSVAQPADEQEKPPVSVHWRNRPSIDVGKMRLDLRAKVAHDWLGFDPPLEEDLNSWRVLRGGIHGEIGNHVEFQIERDLDDDGEWRDVFVSWRTHRQFSVNAGRFKVPFGREQLISITDNDFASRSLVSRTIAPARDKGVMVYGRFLRRGFTYEVGVFDGDGDNGRLREEQFSSEGPLEDIGPSFAGRATATPLRPLAETLERLRVGLAVGASQVPEGLNSLRGTSVHGTTEFVEPVYVNGRRTRVGVEVNYTPGPVGVSAEWMQAREQRKGQGLGDVDLSDFITTGWYAAATWLLTGEDKEDFNNPRQPLFDGGIGAVEVGVRYDTLRFESADKTGPAFSNPRAEHVRRNSDRVWTMGLNWFINRWIRITGNAIHEEFEDAARTPDPGATEFWSGVGRLQVVF